MIDHQKRLPPDLEDFPCCERKTRAWQKVMKTKFTQELLPKGERDISTELGLILKSIYTKAEGVGVNG